MDLGILAMANGWRDTAAYILIGVKEVPVHKAAVVESPSI